MRQILGCYLSASLQTAGNVHFIEGPLFTAGKLTKDGWGIPGDEAQRFADSFVGKPIRYCPHGIPLDGVPADHMCDLQQDAATVIGQVESVYKKEGSDVFYARATISPSIEPKILPDGWSLFASMKAQDDEGFAYGVEAQAISLTSRPLYDEARFKWIAASQPPSAVDDFSDLNKKQREQEAVVNQPMTDQTNADKTQKTPPPAPVEVKPVEKVEKPQQSEQVFTEAQVKKILEEMIPKIKEQTVSETRQAIEKESLAKGLVGRMQELGALEEKDAELRFNTYLSMPKENLELIRHDFEALAGKIGRHEESFQTQPLEKPVRDAPVAEELKGYLAMFGLSEDQYKKIKETHK